MHILLARRNGKWTHAVGSYSPIICARNSRVGGDALLSDKSARLDRVRRAARRRLRGRHQWRLLILPSCVFEMRCVAWCSKIRTDGGRAGATTAALVRTGPSSSDAEAVTRCRLRDANSAAARPASQGLQHKTCNARPARPSAIDGGGARSPSHRRRGLERPASTTARPNAVPS